MLALKNLRRRKLRTALTLLGVGMGIASLVTISGYSRSLKDQIQQTVIKRFDLVVQSKGASSPMASRLEMPEYQNLFNVEGISEVAGIVIGAVKTDNTPYFIVAGTTSYDPLAGNLRLIAGRLPLMGSDEILLGQTAARRFKAGVGDRVSLSHEGHFTVAGIFDAGSRLFNQGAVMGLDSAQRLLNRPANLNLALIRTKGKSGVKRIIAGIQKHQPHLSVLKSRNLLGEIRLFIVVDKITVGLSAIALIISTIFVINTLAMAVIERTKEIGVLMAIGWSRGMIVRTLFAESMLICTLGGGLGILGGWLLLWGFSRSHVTGLDWSAATLPLHIVLMAMALSVLLGVISAVYPAFVASRLTPAQALRAE
jgi:putative ABC transport system permease protein